MAVSSFASLGDFVVWNMRFLPFSPALWSLITVTFGPYGAPLSAHKPCNNLQIFSNASLVGPTFAFNTPAARTDLNLRAVRCFTSPGSGSDLVFAVRALNVYAIASNDTYSYPIGAPTVEKVSGCPLDTTTAAAGCPTAGGIPITINGKNLCQRRETNCSMTVFVDRNRCSQVRHSDDGLSLSCMLPVRLPPPPLSLSTTHLLPVFSFTARFGCSKQSAGGARQQFLTANRWRVAVLHCPNHQQCDRLPDGAGQQRCSSG
jgi:hypothetical protein